MAGSITKLRKDNFTCAICQDEYTDPRNLSCQHVFCHECIVQHVAANDVYGKVHRKQVKGFHCPECRKFHPSKPQKGDEEFPKAFKIDTIHKHIRELDHNTLPPDPVRGESSNAAIEIKSGNGEKTAKSKQKGEFVSVISLDEGENAPEVYDLVVFRQGTGRVVVLPDFGKGRLLSLTLSEDMHVTERRERVIGRKPWRICKTLRRDINMAAITVSNPAGILVCKIAGVDCDDDGDEVWLPTPKQYDGISCLEDGRFVVTTKDNVDILGTDGTIQQAFTVRTSQVKYPDISYVTVTANQSIVLTDFESKTISCITDTGKSVWQKKKAAVGVASDGADCVYFADSRTESVLQVTVSGRLVGKVLTKSDNLSKPSGVAVDSMGFLYVICDSKQIAVWKLSPVA